LSSARATIRGAGDPLPRSSWRALGQCVVALDGLEGKEMKNSNRFLHIPSRRLFAIAQGVPGNRPFFLLKTVDIGSPAQLSATVVELSNPKLWVSRDRMRDRITVELPAASRRRFT